MHARRTGWPASMWRPSSSATSRLPASPGVSPSVSRTPPGIVQPDLLVGLRISSRPARSKTSAPADTGMAERLTASGAVSSRSRPSSVVTGLTVRRGRAGADLPLEPARSCAPDWRPRSRSCEPAEPGELLGCVSVIRRRRRARFGSPRGPPRRRGCGFGGPGCGARPSRGMTLVRREDCVALMTPVGAPES